MAAEETVDKLKKYFENVIKAEEGKEAYIFFPRAFGAEKYEELLKDFDFKEDDEKWTQLYAQKNPRAKYGEMFIPRLRIAFLSSALRDIRAQYLSGKDDHPMTDVDVLRQGPHFSKNQKFRMDYIKLRLKDKS